MAVVATARLSQLLAIQPASEFSRSFSATLCITDPPLEICEDFCLALDAVVGGAVCTFAVLTRNSNRLHALKRSKPATRAKSIASCRGSSHWPKGSLSLMLLARRVEMKANRSWTPPRVSHFRHMLGRDREPKYQSLVPGQR